MSEQPIHVILQNDVMTATPITGQDGVVIEQPIYVHLKEDNIHVQLMEEKLHINSPLVVTPPGALVGAQSEVSGITHAIQTAIDVVRVSATGAVAIKWLMLVTDIENGLCVSSEINMLRQSGGSRFTEFARFGDTAIVIYDIDIIDDVQTVTLSFTSQYDIGMLSIKTIRIGIF